MNISELIEKLEAIKEEHGDVNVAVWQYAGGDDEVCDVSPRYDKSVEQVVLDTTYQ